MYPIDINGSGKVAAIRGNKVFLLCNNFMDIVFDVNRANVISIIFNSVIIIIALDITFFVVFPELISLLIASWILKDDKVSSNENVGIIKEYNDIPSNDIILVYITFTINPNILVKNPPIISKIVDFKNIFFIFFLLYKFSFLLYNCVNKEYWWWL